jgi:hypothetical protein
MFHFFFGLLHSVGPVLSGEVRTYYFQMPFSLSPLILNSTAIPTLKPRMDDPQSRRCGDHNRRERGRGLIYGRKTARKAFQKTRACRAGPVI